MPEPRLERRQAGPRVLLLVSLGLALACPGLSAQTFDRFFTTASERLLLDQARQDFHDPAPAPAPPVLETPIEETTPSGPVVPDIRLSGVVIRGRGQDTSWINGSGIRPDEVTAEGIRVQPERGAPARVQIVLPETAEPIRLKPGQKIDLATGAVLDAYQRDASEDSRSVFDDVTATRPGVGRGSDPSGDGDPDGKPESSAASGG